MFATLLICVALPFGAIVLLIATDPRRTRPS